MADDIDDEAAPDPGIPGGGEDNAGGGFTLPPMTLQSPDILQALALGYLGLGEISDGQWGVQLHGACTTIEVLGVKMTQIDYEPSGSIALPSTLGWNDTWVRKIQYDDHVNKPDIPTERGVLKPWMLSPMLNAIAALGNTIPRDVFLYQDPITKNTISWWVEWSTDSRTCVIYHMEGGIFNLSGKPRDPRYGWIPRNFGRNEILGDARVVKYRFVNYHPGDEQEELIVKDGELVEDVEIRLQDVMPNGKKALFALTGKQGWLPHIYGLAEFTVVGSYDDNTFTITPAVAMGPEEALGTNDWYRTIDRTSLFFGTRTTWRRVVSGALFAAWYDDAGNIERFRIANTVDSEITQRMEYHDNGTNETSPDQKIYLSTAVIQIMLNGAVTHTETMQSLLSVIRPYGSEIYTAQAQLTATGVLINETASLSREVSEYEQFGGRHYDTQAAIHALFWQVGNLAAQTVRISSGGSRRSLPCNYAARKIDRFYHDSHGDLVIEYVDSPDMLDTLGYSFPQLYSPRCYGFVYSNAALLSTDLSYRLGPIRTPTRTLPGETIGGTWETRKRYIAWHPVTGEVLQEDAPCTWI
ncbi:MAG: hypothetical protein LBQ81_09950 [Zoogloeaceae bacterium]|jgi:hypothetical protein|nr:hypothetical protein [Zoogloeaceae bacterium]